ncbi:MAG TPA: RdgB/HAM1 family non-canonical purine NTP pyrophosphatase [Candidatus Lumbricidophila sp.]|nr:RdgB/HAM1 family non-canonical purine NTP pyrophosphatase [Candidatus Lumbricidophila sp.]
MRIVLATHNLHKVDEFQRLVSAQVAGIEIVAYDGPEPVENGTTFTANALIKARGAAAHTGEIALADDSGIVVDVMGAAPGILSARWSGPAASGEANTRLLLAQLADLDRRDRGAAFHCVLALVVPAGVLDAHPDGHEVVAEGVWRGELAYEPRGSYGFGYDPIFEPLGSELTAAELLPEAKNAQSHRARAFAELLPALRQLIGNAIR